MSERTEDVAQQALAQLGFKGACMYRISDPGSSKSRVFLYKLDNDQLIAVKILSRHSAARVTLASELRNRSQLEELIGSKLASVHWYGEVAGHEVVVYEAVGANSLHGEVLNGCMSQQEICEVWKDFLTTMTFMWNRSSENPAEMSPRPYSDRMKRIDNGLKTYLREHFSHEVLHAAVVVNGSEVLSIAEVLTTLECEPARSQSVVCHGDPQPSNIIINRQDRSWKLIDWEWSGGGHDWRMMAAHMYGWWLTRTVRFAQQPTMRFDEGKLYVDYCTIDDDMNKTMRSLTINHMKRYMGADEADMRVLRHYVVLLLLGEVRFAHIWGRETHIPYLIGMAMVLADTGRVRLEDTAYKEEAAA